MNALVTCRYCKKTKPYTESHSARWYYNCCEDIKMKHCVQCTKIPAKRVEVQFKGDGVRTTFCTDKCLAAYKEVETLEVVEAMWDVNEDGVLFMRPAFDNEPLRCTLSRVDGNGVRHRCSKEKSHEKEHSFLCSHASPVPTIACELDFQHAGYHQNGSTSWPDKDSVGNGPEQRLPDPTIGVKTPLLTESEFNVRIGELLEIAGEQPRQYSHYFKDVSKLSTVDVYRVLVLWNVTDPCIQHAIKKLLCAGQRGSKDMAKDMKEVIASCQRWLEMQTEGESRAKPE